MKADALIGKIKAWVEQLAEELKAGHTQGFMSFLEKIGRFHAYSARNMMLILMQRPDASLVAGLRRWNERGRRVKKGERGIAILAPIVKTVEDEEGGPKEKLVGFRTAYVFDFAQTEGAPIEFGHHAPGGEEAYTRLKEAVPVPVEERPLGAGEMGYTDGKRIVLSSLLTPTYRAETLLHEWAHVLLHYDGERRSTTVEELEAEAVAYAVGRELGLSMEKSRDYILHWRGTVEGLEASLERIAGAARRMLERLGAEDNHPTILALQQHSSGAQPHLAH